MPDNIVHSIFILGVVIGGTAVAAAWLFVYAQSNHRRPLTVTEALVEFYEGLAGDPSWPCPDDVWHALAPVHYLDIHRCADRYLDHRGRWTIGRGQWLTIIDNMASQQRVGAGGHTR